MNIKDISRVNAKNITRVNIKDITRGNIKDIVGRISSHSKMMDPVENYLRLASGP